MSEMRTAGVIGWPIAHSKSPLIHRFWLNALGLDGDYARLAVRAEALGGAVRALPLLGLAGVNVTVPHKVAVMAHLDELDPVAQAVGAVNTVVVRADGRLWGTNSDVAGFMEPLAGVDPAGALVIGTGGAARAVLAGLREKAWKTRVLGRDPAKAEALAAEFGAEAGLLDRAELDGVDLLVNASVLGMRGQPGLVLDLGALRPGGTVYDLVYAPLETELLAAARARGLAGIDGLGMLIGQAAVAFRHFFGVEPPRARDAELRALLRGSGA